MAEAGWAQVIESGATSASILDALRAERDRLKAAIDEAKRARASQRPVRRCRYCRKALPKSAQFGRGKLRQYCNGSCRNGMTRWRKRWLGVEVIP